MQAPQGTIEDQTKNHGWGRKIFIHPFLDLGNFFTEATRLHGGMFVAIIAATYFLQGFRSYTFNGAIVWFLRNLGLSSGEVQIGRSTILIAWNIKFLYGLLFDNFPILRCHYKPYNILAALLALVSALVLGIRGAVTSVTASMAMMFLFLMAMAMCDVIADALVSIFLNRYVFLPVLFIFLRNAITPDISDAYDFWLRDRPDGGVIGANTQSYINLVGGATHIVGLLAYGRWFTGTPFRNIFFWTQIIMGVLGFMDVALYKQWNVAVHFPDLPFLFFNNSITHVFYQLTSMPFLVMAAQLAPADIEATFFAGITSVSNGGNNLATLWSGKMLIALGVDYVDPATNVRTYDLQKLEIAVWIRFAMTFAPALLVWMVPNSSSIDPYGEENKRETTVAEVDAAEVKDVEAKNLEHAKSEEENKELLAEAK
ncbi:BT1 family-domain-containing protein [Cladochytrium replicatum]|nr:BT1 family-domain-containing protein [Cladochytrium replicatum]